MKNLWKENDGVFEVAPGSQITNTIQEAIELSQKESRQIAFDFNGVKVSVRADSNQALIYRDWSRALNRYINKEVGPYPAAELTEAEMASDAKIETQNEAKRKASQEEYDTRAKAKKAEVTNKLATTPLMEFKDEDGWRETVAKNQDGYGGAVMIYAEQWARLMQSEMSKGKKVEDIADATSHEADTEGITGFQYGCAVSILFHCWVHGEELLRWHNLKTQIKDEGEEANDSGGVLNPALLPIGG